jgi:hypothetical protein
MRLLFTVVHFFRGGAKGLRNYGSMGRNSAPRVQALTDCIASIHEHFGGGQFSLNHGQRQADAANQTMRHKVDVVVCTVKDMHLLGELDVPKGAYHHHLTTADPTVLGYECHAVLRDHLGKYDFYCYLEDDLVMRDPMFFSKLQWFNQLTGKQDLLQPNRYEVSFKSNVNKVYVDGPLPPRSTAPFQKVDERNLLKATVLGQDMLFRRTLNPHSGSFFLNEQQMRTWASKPYFLDRSPAFIGPPESAATLGIMKTFRVYKPAVRNASFLELQHCGTSYLDLLGGRVALPGRAPAAKPAAPKVVAKPAPVAKRSAPDPVVSVEDAVEQGLKDFGF